MHPPCRVQSVCLYLTPDFRYIPISPLVFFLPIFFFPFFFCFFLCAPILRAILSHTAHLHGVCTLNSAAGAGLKVDDRILSIDESTCHHVVYKEAVELIAAAKAKREVRLCVIADSEGAERQQALYVCPIRIRCQLVHCRCDCICDSV